MTNINTAKTPAEKAWEKHKDNNQPIGLHEFYYKDNREYFIAGYKYALLEAQELNKVLADALYLFATSGHIEKTFPDGYKAAREALIKFKKMRVEG